MLLIIQCDICQGLVTVLHKNKLYMHESGLLSNTHFHKTIFFKWNLRKAQKWLILCLDLYFLSACRNFLPSFTLLLIGCYWLVVTFWLFVRISGNLVADWSLLFGLLSEFLRILSLNGPYFSAPCRNFELSCRWLVVLFLFFSRPLVRISARDPSNQNFDFVPRAWGAERELINSWCLTAFAHFWLLNGRTILIITTCSSDTCLHHTFSVTFISIKCLMVFSTRVSG